MPWGDVLVEAKAEAVVAVAALPTRHLRPLVLPEPQLRDEQLPL